MIDLHKMDIQISKNNYSLNICLSLFFYLTSFIKEKAYWQQETVIDCCVLQNPWLLPHRAGRTLAVPFQGYSRARGGIHQGNIMPGFPLQEQEAAQQA